MRLGVIQCFRNPPQPLRGFWNEKEAARKMPCISQPDLVDQRNKFTDRTPRGKRNITARDNGINKDCGVRALAVCANIPYGRANVLLPRASNGGVYPQDILNVLFDLGYVIKKIVVNARTMLTLERELKHGIYYVHSTMHSTALVNGRVWDNWRGRKKRILGVYKITP